MSGVEVAGLVVLALLALKFFSGGGPSVFSGAGAGAGSTSSEDQASTAGRPGVDSWAAPTVLTDQQTFVPGVGIVTDPVLSQAARARARARLEGIMEWQRTSPAFAASTAQALAFRAAGRPGFGARETLQATSPDERDRQARQVVRDSAAYRHEIGRVIENFRAAPWAVRSGLAATVAAVRAMRPRPLLEEFMSDANAAAAAAGIGSATGLGSDQDSLLRDVWEEQRLNEEGGR